MNPVKTKPVFKDYLWGGTKLKEEYGKQSDMPVIAESWELSCNPAGLCTVDGGEYGGMTLRDCLAAQDFHALGYCCGNAELPVLIKLIDAYGDLSVQVHPDDCYALAHEHSFGKTEMWYVLDCRPGAAIYFGLKQDAAKAQIERAIDNEALTSLLNRVAVRAGDVFFIPPGTIHAIGSGIVIAEIQQNSDVTYRMYDYGRKDAQGRYRRLDVEKALDTAVLTKSAPFMSSQQVLVSNEHYRETLLARCPYFSTYLVDVVRPTIFQTAPKSFEALLLIDGSCRLSGKSATLFLKKGDCAFLPADTGLYSIEGACKYLRIHAGDVASRENM